MLNLETLQNEVSAGDEVRYLFADYEDSSSYICDGISERADSRIDIYTYDLMEWAKSHIYECDEALKEMGGSFDSITQVIQHAQFFENERELYDEIEDGILWACYEAAKEYAEEITEEQNEQIEELAESLDSNSRFDEITNGIALIFANNEE
jgi:hypothetical protein